MKYKRVAITEKAIKILKQLKEKHGELIFHQNGGCCDGSAPMILKKEICTWTIVMFYLDN